VAAAEVMTVVMTVVAATTATTSEAKPEEIRDSHFTLLHLFLETLSKKC
jgi:hypothetical protein